jgi:hypothetical protein
MAWRRRRWEERGRERRVEEREIRNILVIYGFAEELQ